jgi:ATP-dependent RNA helicase RhlE
MTFKDLDLIPSILRAVEAAGYVEPTPIQARAIPIVLRGEDIMAGAQTGTGKTAAFALPILDDIDYIGGDEPIALVLTPTRELAQQVADSFQTYGRFISVRQAVLVGGASFDNQVRALAAGPQVIVATPGRLLDHLQRGRLHLDSVRTLVLDEADRMLDMGFIHDVKRIIRKLPKKRQTLFFSATLRPDVESLARDILNNPIRVGIKPDYETAEHVRQRLIRVDSARRRQLLAHLLSSEGWDQVLVFTRTRRGAETLTMVLRNKEFSVEEIHGNRSQKERNAALAAFKSGKVAVLVATDVASRGLDIRGISHVVNFDMPNNPEEYVHRIGRTGRAGALGHAVSFVVADDWPLLREIESATGKEIRRTTVPGFEPSWSEPIASGPKDWDGKGVKVVYSAFSGNGSGAEA